MHFLSLVQFVAIYALLGGPIRPQICGGGTAIDFKGWGKCHQHCRKSDECQYWNWYHTSTVYRLCILFSKLDGTETLPGWFGGKVGKACQDALLHLCTVNAVI